jgi:hypothetical protein
MRCWKVPACSMKTGSLSETIWVTEDGCQLITQFERKLYVK